MNVELEPGFKTNVQKRDNSRFSSQCLIQVSIEMYKKFTKMKFLNAVL